MRLGNCSNGLHKNQVRKRDLQRQGGEPLETGVTRDPTLVAFSNRVHDHGRGRRDHQAQTEPDDEQLVGQKMRSGN